MRQISAILVVAVALFISFGCAPPKPDMAAFQKAVDEFNAASKEALMTGNTDKVNSYYETGAYEMAPNTPLIKGKAAIHDFQNSMSKSGMKFNKVSFSTLDLAVDGKLGYEIGSYDMSFSMAQMPDMRDTGKYMTLWKQQGDGMWKVYAETWNTSTPMPPMPTEGMAKKK